MEVAMNLYEQIGEEKIDQLVMYMYDDIIPNYLMKDLKKLKLNKRNFLDYF